MYYGVRFDGQHLPLSAYGLCHDKGIEANVGSYIQANISIVQDLPEVAYFSAVSEMWVKEDIGIDRLMWIQYHIEVENIDFNRLSFSPQIELLQKSIVDPRGVGKWREASGY